MAMSRRKQLHPKSLKGTLKLVNFDFTLLLLFKEGDETIFVLPDELKCDEEVRSINSRKRKDFFFFFYIL
jgi:hypothetical protein